jgi:hypothetical protein
MDDLNLTDDEARELRRLKKRAWLRTLTVLVIAAVSTVAGFALYQALRAFNTGRSTGRIDGDLMFMPAAVLLTAMVILAPRKLGHAASKVELVLANKREQLIPRVLLMEALLGLAIAGEFAWSRRFSASLILLPVVILSLLRFRRPNDELGQAFIHRAMTAGFLCAFVTLSTLVVAAGFSPEWLGRLAPMALAIPMAVAATAYALASWQADREA